MFTGIIETLGKIQKIEAEQANLHFYVESPLAPELKIDQSLSHNGVCLTVVALSQNTHKVTAIAETLSKTSLKHWKEGQMVNLERGMPLNARLDGHLVQGHTDQVGICTEIIPQQGSTLFTFTYAPETGNITIEKGSITVNGVSLTVINSQKGRFSVAIIPYTLAHTTFQYLQKGDVVNLEFDVVGKYILAQARNLNPYFQQ